MKPGERAQPVVWKTEVTLHALTRLLQTRAGYEESLRTWNEALASL